jgi:hypothetical protein
MLHGTHAGARHPLEDRVLLSAADRIIDRLGPSLDCACFFVGGFGSHSRRCRLDQR